MTIEVKMPQMGESIAEGTVVRWHKKVGDRVARDEPLFEISTDKVDTEVPAPEEGILIEVLVEEGETVPIHTVVCILSERLEDTGKRSSTEARVDAPVRADPPGAPAGACPEGGPARGAGARRRGTTPSAAPDARTPATRPRAPATQATPTASSATPRRLRELSSPLVRRLAVEEAVDLARVPGSGAQGRVTRDDLLEHLAERRRGSGAESPKPLTERLEPMSVMRRQIAEHMIASRQTSAHVSTIFEVDMTEIAVLRTAYGREYEDLYGIKLTFMPFLVYAVASGLHRFPILNASIEGDRVRYHGSINLGVAVALEEGLIVPVIRDAQDKGLLDLAREIQDLADRARSKKLHPDEVQGGTFTITNPGRHGGLIGTPILNQPQSGILYVGAVQKRPVVLPGTDAIAVRSMVYLSLSFDHRLIDGYDSDRFLAHVKAVLENWS